MVVKVVVTKVVVMVDVVVLLEVFRAILVEMQPNQALIQVH